MKATVIDHHQPSITNEVSFAVHNAHELIYDFKYLQTSTRQIALNIVPENHRTERSDNQDRDDEEELTVEGLIAMCINFPCILEIFRYNSCKNAEITWTRKYKDKNFLDLSEEQKQEPQEQHQRTRRSTQQEFSMANFLMIIL